MKLTDEQIKQLNHHIYHRYCKAVKLLEEAQWYVADYEKYRGPGVISVGDMIRKFFLEEDDESTSVPNCS